MAIYLQSTRAMKTGVAMALIVLLAGTLAQADELAPPKGPPKSSAATTKTAEKVDLIRAAQVPVVLRVESGQTGSAGEFVAGVEKWQGEYVNILEVLKNEGPDKELSTRRQTMLWHEKDVTLPAGQFIAYLKPKMHDKGPCDYYLVGDEATARKAAAQEIGKYLTLGVAGGKLPASFGVGFDFVGPKFGDMKPVCQLLLDAGFIELATAPHDEKKRTSDDAPCREVSVHVAGHSLYVIECFCESPFADDKHTQRFRQLHAALTSLALPVTAEEKKRKEDIDAIRRYLAYGAAGRELPATFKVHIETDGVSRPVSVFEAWNFTPTTVERLGYVKVGTNWQVQAVATTKEPVLKQVCQTLLDAGFVELVLTGHVSGGGAGPFFRGTPFCGGERTITVSGEGHTLSIGKSCWRGIFDDDTDREQQFAKLYEAVKKQAPSPAAAIREAIATGAAGGELPASLEVLIETFGSKEKGGEGLDSIVSEAWRFTPTAVDTFNCNVVDKTRQITGLKEVCAALQAAGFAELADAKRGEDYAGKLVFDGTSCSDGWRYIRVTVDGQSQTIGEGTTWPAFADAKQSQRMRELYEALRKIAQTKEK